MKNAFANGEFNGVFQSYYFKKFSESDTKDHDILTFGLDLSYKTAKYRGFGFKTTLQSSYSPWVSEKAERNQRGNMWGDGAEFSEAYLSYEYDKTIAKIGRMFLSTPTAAGSGSRLTKEAFQGIYLQNSNIPDTTIEFAFVDKFQSRTDGDGEIGDFSDTFKLAAAPWDVVLENGAYVIAVENRSIENLTLTGSYTDAIGCFETAYAEAALKIGTIGLASQYYNSKLDDEKDRGNLFGLKADVTFGDLNLLVAYTKTGSDADVIPGLGNGADLAYTWSEIFAYQYEKDQDSVKFAAKYNFLEKASIGISHLIENGEGYERAYTTLCCNYKFAGKLDGLDLGLAYEIGSQDASDDELRIKLNYHF